MTWFWFYAVQWFSMAFLGRTDKQLTSLQRGNWSPQCFLDTKFSIMSQCRTKIYNLLQEFEKMKEKAPENFRLDFAVSREQINEKGEKMYIQTRMAEYAEELWTLLQKDNTFIYMCGLKGMEQGIDEIMSSLAERDGNICQNYVVIFSTHW